MPWGTDGTRVLKGPSVWTEHWDAWCDRNVGKWNVEVIQRNFICLLSIVSLWILCVCVCMCASSVTSAVSDSLRPTHCNPTRLLCPWDFSSKSSGVGYHALLLGSSWPKVRIYVSWIAGEFFYHWEVAAVSSEWYWDVWPPEERNSIQDQSRGLITRSFCVAQFY